jgi:cell wall assembly regulator SMI1
MVDRLNPPAKDDDLARFQNAVGPLPDDVIALYRDHDGSERLLRPYMATLIARLMPAAEALKNQLLLNRVAIPKAGTVA